MARYLETAKEAKLIADQLIDECHLDPDQIVALGHLINLVVRCSPRAVQHTVRERIVSTILKDHARVSMEEKVDTQTARVYNVIRIVPKHRPEMSEVAPRGEK